MRVKINKRHQKLLLLQRIDLISEKQRTIRKKFGISIDKNSVHGSDSVENAKIEIDFFFKD